MCILAAARPLTFSPLVSHRVLEQSFQREQQYADRVDTCKALITHLQKVALSGGGATTNHAISAIGASPELEEDSSPSASATNLEHPPSSPVPARSGSDPTPASAAPQKEGYILRREDEVLVPTRVTLTRKRSKKDKRRQPVSFASLV